MAGPNRLETLGGDRAGPLGLGGSPGTGREFVEAAREAGVNYYFL